VARFAGLLHLQRVARNARVIMASYPEADAEILFLAVLLHDVNQPFDDKRNHVSRSVKWAEQLLEHAVGIRLHRIEKIRIIRSWRAMEPSGRPR
jgi:HD superfamily phosphodiesterase